MGRVFSDADFADQGKRIFSDADFSDAVADQPRQAADAGEALLTNLPTKGFGQDIVRGLPATAGAIPGALAGAAAVAPFAPLAGPFAPAVIAAGGIGGAFLGGAAGESVRQATAQGVSAAFPEQNYPMARPEEVVRDVAIQGASQAAGEGFGAVAGAGLRAAGRGIKNIAPAFIKVASSVPEKSAAAAVNDLGLLGRAPSEAGVSAAYDAFHSASGTVSRKEAIARSGDPFDTTQRAYRAMSEAYNKLRAGTLTVQEAVEASQAGRLIRDMKARGTEFAQEIAETADRLKAQFDGFIENGIGPRTEMRQIPVAQEIVPEVTPIASRLEPKSDVFHSATTLVPESVNVPVQGAQNIAGDIRRVVEVSRRARAQGVNPKTLMTDAERTLFDQFRTQIDSAVDHRVPIETLLTPSEMSAPVAGFAERTVLREGDPIYAGANRYAFGGTVDKVSYKPGSEIMGDWPLHVPSKPGYSEWQAARQAAFERSVADDFGSFFPRNVNGQPSLLAAKAAIGGGAATGAAVGGMIGGPVGAGVGLVVGGVGGMITSSPMAYGAAIRGANYAAKAAPTVYRVGATAGQAAVGGAGSAIADAYMRQRPAIP